MQYDEAHCRSQNVIFPLQWVVFNFDIHSPPWNTCFPICCQVGLATSLRQGQNSRIEYAHLAAILRSRRSNTKQIFIWKRKKNYSKQKIILQLHPSKMCQFCVFCSLPFWAGVHTLQYRAYTLTVCNVLPWWLMMKILMMMFVSMFFKIFLPPLPCVLLASPPPLWTSLHCPIIFQWWMEREHLVEDSHQKVQRKGKLST